MTSFAFGGVLAVLALLALAVGPFVVVAVFAAKDSDELLGDRAPDRAAHVPPLGEEGEGDLELPAA